jgi:hypothetical protein
MAAVRKKVFSMYLTDWQMRLVKDVSGVDCHRWDIPLEQDPVVRYGIREPENPQAVRMYLTEWQRRQMQDEVGSCCNFVEIEPEMVLKYSAPTVLKYSAPHVMYGPPFVVKYAAPE